MAEADGDDLVEYMIVLAPEIEAVPSLSLAVAALATSSMIRILDAVVVVRHRDGSLDVREVAGSDQFVELRRVMYDEICLLSDHDIALASMALPAGAAGLIVVVEDQWAEPLSAAARRVGGQIVAGERIPARRVQRVVRELSRKEDE